MYGAGAREARERRYGKRNVSFSQLEAAYALFLIALGQARESLVKIDCDAVITRNKRAQNKDRKKITSLFCYYIDSLIIIITLVIAVILVLFIQGL